MVRTHTHLRYGVHTAAQHLIKPPVLLFLPPYYKYIR